VYQKSPRKCWEKIDWIAFVQSLKDDVFKLKDLAIHANLAKSLGCSGLFFSTNRQRATYSKALSGFLFHIRAHSFLPSLR